VDSEWQKFHGGDYNIGMNAESDRGAVLVAAAYIDDALGCVLTAAFVADTAVTKRLLEYPGAASTLAARTDLAYCFGLIGRDMYEDIRRITKIRNRFAHAMTGARFSNPQVGPLCVDFNVIKGMQAHGTQFHGLGPRDFFTFSAAVIISKLSRLLRTIKHRNAGPTLADIQYPEGTFWY
jgi:DNA-binding MltR family transcriptional regulator